LEEGEALWMPGLRLSGTLCSLVLLSSALLSAVVVAVAEAGFAYSALEQDRSL
jgi:hypothetical protein